MAKDMYQKRKERKEAKVNNGESLHKTSINWYPGHMAKTRREIVEKLQLVDIVYEVIDARIPYSSRINDLDKLVKNKPRILILTKYDLCDKEETDRFIKYYETINYKVVTVEIETKNIASKLVDLSNLLLEDEIVKRTNKGLKPRSIRAMVVGVPNVGKSTLINKIVGKNVCKVANKPGVTTTINWLRLGKNIDLMDTPGILWPKIDTQMMAYNLATFTAIKEEILPKEDVVNYIFERLNNLYKEVLNNNYRITSYNSNDLEDYLKSIGKSKGFLSKGGIIDIDKVLTLVLNDIKTGKIKNITFDRIGDING